MRSCVSRSEVFGVQNLYNPRQSRAMQSQDRKPTYFKSSNIYLITAFMMIRTVRQSCNGIAKFICIVNWMHCSKHGTQLDASSAIHPIGKARYYRDAPQHCCTCMYQSSTSMLTCTQHCTEKAFLRSRNRSILQCLAKRLTLTAWVRRLLQLLRFQSRLLQNGSHQREHVLQLGLWLQ